MPKLIEYGWDMRNSIWVGDNVTQMESKPFDGFVFSAKLSDGNLFHSLVWGTRRIDISELSDSIGALTTSKFTNLKDRFLRVGVEPGLDWFKGYDTILCNFSTACSFAKKTGCAGLFLDLEPYGKKIFDYTQIDYGAKRTLNQYKDQVEAVGAALLQVLNSFADGFDNTKSLKIFLTFGYAQCNTTTYALLESFLNGLTSTQGPILFIDGHENAYTASSIQDFKRILNDKGLGKYKSTNIREGAFGVSLEAHPSDLTLALTNALKTTDKYVWLYTQNSADWWASGTNAYTAQVLAARAAVGI